jgi:hypothetical protein
MQEGTERWQAAGWLGMTLEQLENGYGHHHPDFQEEAAEAFGAGARRLNPYFMCISLRAKDIESISN